jgi:hypothetical protein
MGISQYILNHASKAVHLTLIYTHAFLPTHIRSQHNYLKKIIGLFKVHGRPSVATMVRYKRGGEYEYLAQAIDRLETTFAYHEKKPLAEAWVLY